MPSAERVLFGLFLATIGIILGYQIVPKYLSYLITPLCVMRRDHQGYGRADENEHLLIHLSLLYSYYVFGALIFITTGGALAQLASSDIFTNPTAICVSLATGILLVAMVRVEAIRHTTDLYDSFQQLSVSAVSAGLFIFGADRKLFASVQEVFRSAGPDVYACWFAGPLVPIALIEGFYFASHRLGNARYRLVPFGLIRQRIDSEELVEQVWSPWEVNQWTSRQIQRILRSQGPADVCWLTVTHPGDLLDEINTSSRIWGTHNRIEDADIDARIRSNVKILLPVSQRDWVQNHLAGHPLFECIQYFSGDRPRTRIMILNGDAAIVHLPLNYDHEDLNQASNFAALVRDPGRIGSWRVEFQHLWNRSVPAAQEVARGAGS